MFKKKILTFLLMALSISIHAQMDTVVVQPGLNTLADALEDAANWGKVLKLKAGGIYVSNRVLSPTDSTGGKCIIVGEPFSDDVRPAMIQRLLDPGQTEWEDIFASEIKGEHKFVNIGWYGYNQTGEPLLSAIHLYNGPGTLEIDNCYFFNGGTYGAFMVETDSIVQVNVRNNKFINVFNPFDWQQGSPWEGWGGMYIDTWNFENNSIIITGGYGTGDGQGVTDMIVNHNTFIAVERKLGDDSYMVYKNRYFTNNIVVDCGTRGYVGPRTSNDWREDPDSAAYPGDYSAPSHVDSISALFSMDSLANTWISSLVTNIPTEEERIIQVKNNLVYYGPELMAHFASLTASPMPFINNQGQLLIDLYANRVAEGNMEDVDPQFVKGLPAESWTNFFQNEVERRKTWLQDPSIYPRPREWNISGDTWFGDASKIEWPIPLDLRPQNPAVDGAGTDGYPLGDLNWWVSVDDSILTRYYAGRPYVLVGVKENTPEIPAKYTLAQNYPNPFNPNTIINYEISKPANVSLIVYNITGEKVRTLIDNTTLPKGIGEVSWDGTNDFGNKMVSGIYLYQLTVDNKVIGTRKMMLLK